MSTKPNFDMQTQYHYRYSALDQEVFLALEPDVLLLNGVAIRYEEVADVHLSKQTQQYQRPHFVCHVTLHSGWHFYVASRHYAGFADFQFFDQEYSAFVQALHRMLHAKNPAVTYRAGSTALRMWLSVAGLNLVGLLCLGLLWAIKPWVALVFFGFMLLVSLKYYTDHRLTLYTPDALPSRFMPTRGVG